MHTDPGSPESFHKAQDVSHHRALHSLAGVQNDLSVLMPTHPSEMRGREEKPLVLEGTVQMHMQAQSLAIRTRHGSQLATPERHAAMLAFVRQRCVFPK
jgi:hypothetical protein